MMKQEIKVWCKREPEGWIARVRNADAMRSGWRKLKRKDEG